MNQQTYKTYKLNNSNRSGDSHFEINSVEELCVFLLYAICVHMVLRCSKLVSCYRTRIQKHDAS